MSTFDILMKVESGFEQKIMSKLAPSVPIVDYVYHYTNIDSFLKIIKYNQLWFSHSSYMNDPLEIEFGISVLLDILKKNRLSSDLIKIIEDKQKEHLFHSLTLRRDLSFVFSFTEIKDHLPFWVQYANYGNGICMGFINSKILSSIAPVIPINKHMYFPVQYYAKHFAPSKNNILLFEKVIVEYYSEMDSLLGDLAIDDKHQFKHSIFAMTKLIAAFIKHDFHEDEKEWRFVIFSGIGENNIEIVPAQSSVKMFYNINLAENKIINIIESIITGPSYMEDDRVSAALEIALWKYQGIRFIVEKSKGKIINPKT